MRRNIRLCFIRLRVLFGIDQVECCGQNNILLSQNRFDTRIDFIIWQDTTALAFLFADHRKAGFSPRIRQEVVNSIAVIGLVGAGYGVGFVIGSMRKLGRGDVAFIPIEGKSPELPLALAHDPARTSSALDRFIEFVEARSPQGV
ncbi:MAG: LysR substrate-binding domain-containing protein [Bacteroidota bacterium]